MKRNDNFQAFLGIAFILVVGFVIVGVLRPERKRTGGVRHARHHPAVIARPVTRPGTAPAVSLPSATAPVAAVIPVAPVVPPLHAKGKIAIVIDDWGYTLATLPIAGEIKYTLTAAVLPHLAHSREVARRLHEIGHEVILHLPMEPQEKRTMEKNSILTSLAESTIRTIVAGDLDDLVYARGVSNHQGSAATADTRTMRIVFSELKKRRLFFLDSYVSSDSVGKPVAADTGIPYARRDVFIDNRLEAGYIKGRIELLKKKAARRGYAVGIGHDRKVTLDVLREVMPQMAQEGFELVPVSELAIVKTE